MAFVAAAAMALVVQAGVAEATTGYQFGGTVWHPKALPTLPAVSGHALTTEPVTPAAKHTKALGRYTAAAPKWPAAGTSTVTLTPRTPAAPAPTTPAKAESPAPETPSAAAPTSPATPSARTLTTPDAARPAASARPSATPSAKTSAKTSARPKTPAVTAKPHVRPVRAGSLPVWVEPTAAGRNAAPAAQAPGKVTVRLASHAQAVRAGANGMLIGLRRADGRTAGGTVQVVIDYSALAKAYGGGYGSRLRVYQVPACVLTTPGAQGCGTRTPVAFTNRAGSGQLTATVALRPAAGAAAASAAAPMTALAVTSGTGGSQGSYAATSLTPAGTWQASGTGAFTYTYPVDVPSAVGGNTPSVALSYDSQAVDGETSARNSQASWVGDGWSFEPGFVERTYRPCGGLLDGDHDHILKDSGDECWGGDNATMSFGSHSGVLIPTGTTVSDPDVVQQWALQGDDGTVIQEMKGADNGLYQGIYYRVLSTDGSVAYFGADHAPTAAGPGGTMQSGTPSDSSTDSAWGVPVLHPVSSDPCYDSTDGKKSQCSDPEGWRWNLDFVVTPSGFVQRYDYDTQSNYYDLGGGQVAASDGSGTLTKYTRGGQLTSISYGYTVAGELAGDTPGAQVDFTSGQRCETTSSFDCTDAISTDNATHWPDVPYDLNCPSTDSTTIPKDATKIPDDVCAITSPSFWTTTRLDTITTKVNVKGTGLTKVDAYGLDQTYSDAGGTVDPVTGTTIDPADAGELQAVMWLQTITHTGYDSDNGHITTNPVTFQGTEIDNRVNDSSPQAPPLYRPRISQIQTETGGDISVDYNVNPCAGLTLSMSGADSNTHSCYPVYWAPAGQSQPIADWFNKTTVHQVTVSDLTVAGLYKPGQAHTPAGSEPQVTTYSYGPAAWHRDDSALTDDQYRTWDQFRGFHTVTTETGTAPDPVTRSTVTYLQGMDGDYQADGTRRSVSVDAKVAGQTVETVTDSDWLAGTPLETDSYASAGGSIDAEQVTGPFTFTQTASKSQTPWTDWNSTDEPGTTEPTLSTLPDLTAHRPSSMGGTSYALLADGTTWRQTKSTSTYDSEGRPAVQDTQAVDSGLGVTPAPLQEDCSTTSYATPPSGDPMMLEYPDRVTDVTGAMTAGDICPAATSGNLLSDSETYYDGDGTLTNLPPLGRLGTTGLPDATATASAWPAGGTEQWRTGAAMSYDGAGRATQVLTPDPTGTKPAGLKTTTAYDPAWSTAGTVTNPTTITTTNPQTWKTTSTLDPLRGLTTANVDENTRETDTTYDALGRRTAVWLPGRDQATQSADETFSYSVDPGAVSAPTGPITSPGAPTAVTTRTLREDDTYATTVDIYDGLLQPRQTQTSPLGDTDDGRLISDTFYDSHGWPTVDYATYSEPDDPPSTTLFAADENTVPSESTTDYDGQGRPVTATTWHDAIAQWHTSTSYPGADETVVTPPGAATNEAFTNALGQTVKTTVLNDNTGTRNALTLTGGQVISSGTSLMSDSTRLAMQAGGDLVLTSLASGKQLWHSGTSSAGSYAVFGTDGNLGVYSSTGTKQWGTSLTATTGATLDLGDDGDLAVHDSGGTSLWDTATSASPADSTTGYTYYPSGQLHTTTDTAGNTWTDAYDLLGELTQQTDPNLGTSTFGPYDVDGNLLQTTDARGQKIGYTYDWNDRRTAEYDLTKASTETQGSANELASWDYDTLADGYPTDSVRYTPDGQYKEAVTGYDTAYQPLGATLTVPAGQGFAAAGQTAPPTGTGATVTYTLGASYFPNTGLLDTTTFQADGGLPAEQVSYGYNQQGDLNGFGSYINPTSTPDYADDTAHDALGDVLETDYGPTGKELATYGQYDPTTGAVTQTSSELQGSSTALDVTDYRYDQAGDITAVDDLQNNTTHDTQCFTYDSFQRLTQAWTDTNGIADPTSDDPAPGDLGGCVKSAPVTTTPHTTTVGGPAPYWQSYTYDLLGDRTGMVSHDTGGNAANDTTQSIAFAGADATAPATDPDQGGTVTVSNPTLGSTTQTVSHTDTQYTPNVNAGDTISRTTTATGRVTTAFTVSGGGTLCVENAGAVTTAGNKVQVNTCSAGAADQTLAIGSDDTVKIQGKCLDTVGQATASGTKVDINTCATGKNTQLWKPGQDGTLVNGAAPTLCLTDPSGGAKTTQLTIAACTGADAKWGTPASTTANASGSTPAGQQETFTYDAEGRTQTVTTGTGATTSTSTYLYDADGSLLEQTTGKGSTAVTRVLYLFGGTEQITLNVSAKTFTALRDYAGPDGTTITRTSGGAVFYQLANAQGTAETDVNASTLAVNRRYYDPYGDPRGAAPSSWISPDENRGFLGRPTDPGSGLDLLGARTYDPTQGRFTSPDPVFEAGDPNQMGGYTYAGDNPSTGSDPTGLWSWGGAFTGLGDGFIGDFAVSIGNHFISAGNSVADFAATYTYGFTPMGPNGPAFVDQHVHPFTPFANHPLAHVFHQNTNESTYQGFNLIGSVGPIALDGAGLIADAANGTKIAEGADGAVRVLKKALDDDHDPVAGKGGGSHSSGGSGKDDSTSSGSAGHDSTKPSDPEKGTSSTPKTRTHSSSGDDGGSGGSGDSGGGSGGCSFSPDTKVLMAGRKTKPIGTIKPGDRVESASPATGEHAGARTVTHVWINHDKDLLDLTVRTSAGHTAVLRTTAEHPFWDATTHAWVAAGHLVTGHALTTPDGHKVYVAALRTTPGAADRWNLTVSRLHTYYVLAGGVPVLVHNTCDVNGHETDPALQATSNWTPDANYSPEAVASRSKASADFYAVPQETHDLVDAYRANPNMPPRAGKGAGGLDLFRADDLSGKARGFWGPWRNSPIYWNRKPSSQIRIMVNGTTGQIAYFPLDSKGVHIYGSPVLYIW